MLSACSTKGTGLARDLAVFLLYLMPADTRPCMILSNGPNHAQPRTSTNRDSDKMVIFTEMSVTSEIVRTKLGTFLPLNSLYWRSPSYLFPEHKCNSIPALATLYCIMYFLAIFSMNWKSPVQGDKISPQQNYNKLLGGNLISSFVLPMPKDTQVPFQIYCKLPTYPIMLKFCTRLEEIGSK